MNAAISPALLDKLRPFDHRSLAFLKKISKATKHVKSQAKRKPEMREKKMELQVSEAIIEAPTQTAQKKSEFRVSEAKLHCECKKKFFSLPSLVALRSPARMAHVIKRMLVASIQSTIRLPRIRAAQLLVQCIL